MKKLLIIGAAALLGACAQPQGRAPAPDYQAPNYPQAQASTYYDASWRTKWKVAIPAQYANGTCTYVFTASATGHQTFSCPGTAAARAPAPSYSPAYAPAYVPTPYYGGGRSSSYDDDREELEDRIQELQDRIDDLEMQQMMNDDD